MTEVRRIQLSATRDVGQAIKDECDIMSAAGYVLASTFVYGGQLVLIFQEK